MFDFFLILQQIAAWFGLDAPSLIIFWAIYLFFVNSVFFNKRNEEFWESSNIAKSILPAFGFFLITHFFSLGVSSLITIFLARGLEEVNAALTPSFFYWAIHFSMIIAVVLAISRLKKRAGLTSESKKIDIIRANANFVQIWFLFILIGFILGVMTSLKGPLIAENLFRISFLYAFISILSPIIFTILMIFMQEKRPFNLSYLEKLMEKIGTNLKSRGRVNMAFWGMIIVIAVVAIFLTSPTIESSSIKKTYAHLTIWNDYDTQILYLEDLERGIEIDHNIFFNLLDKMAILPESIPEKYSYEYPYNKTPNEGCRHFVTEDNNLLIQEGRTMFKSTKPVCYLQKNSFSKTAITTKYEEKTQIREKKVEEIDLELKVEDTNYGKINILNYKDRFHPEELRESSRTQTYFEWRIIKPANCKVISCHQVYYSPSEGRYYTEEHCSFDNQETISYVFDSAVWVRNNGGERSGKIIVEIKCENSEETN